MEQDGKLPIQVNDLGKIEEPCMGSLAIRRLSKKSNSPKEIWLKRHSDTLAANPKPDNQGYNYGIKYSTTSMCHNVLDASANKLICNNSNYLNASKSNVTLAENSPLDFSNTTSKLSSLRIEQSQNESALEPRPLSATRSFNYILAIQPITPFDSLPNLFTFSPISTSSPIHFDSASTPSFIISPSAYLSTSPLLSPPSSSSSSPNPESRKHLYARRRSLGQIRPICLPNIESQTQVIALPTTPVNLTLPPSPRTLLSPIPEMRTADGEAESTKGAHQLPQHKCSYCQRCFSRSDMLSRHLRLHTGHRPYECPYCSQVFSRSDHLQTHLRTHTGEKPYRCAECGYAAPRRDMVTRHMRVHENRGDSGCRIKKTKSSELGKQAQRDASKEGDELLRQHMRQQIKIMYEQNQLTKKQMVNSQVQDFIFNELKRMKDATGGVTDQLVGLQLPAEATIVDADLGAAIEVKDEIEEEIKDHGFEDSEPNASSTSPDVIRVLIAPENTNLSRTISEGSMDSGVSYLTPCTPASTLWSPCSPGVTAATSDLALRNGSRFQWPADAKS